MEAPKVFISYSHDSHDHKQWVLRLGTDLRERGIDASLDQWDLSLGQDVAAFMHRGIAEADRVLLICSEKYVTKAEEGLGGVGYERLIVTADIVQNIDTKKFIPVVRNNESEKKVPGFLGPRRYIDLSEEQLYGERLDELVRELLAVPSNAKPPLGVNPFSGVSPSLVEPMRRAGPTGVTGSGERVLDGEWYDQEHRAAISGIERLGMKAHMEVRLGLHDPIAKSQIELLTQLRKSEIRTFGWPIAITLENKEEHRPRPYADGIRAEVAIGEDSLLGRKSYDYWALRSNGDFYTLQSLFEDDRAKDAIFFNTRIVRVTEALMLAANLYTNLGVDPEARLSVRVAHRGFAGRRLTSSSPNRHVMPSTTKEDQSQVEVVVVLGRIHELLVENVQRITEPLFMLFDFAQFDNSVYTDIVRRFEKGDVS